MKTTELVRLPNTYENWKGTSLYLKQTYYIGRIDSTKKDKGNSSILPTQRVAYTLHYDSKVYNFIQNDQDTYHVFPDYYYESNFARDSLTVHHLENSFSYSFYLRSKNPAAAKNEAKLDVGLTQDIYSYNQYVADTVLDPYGSRINGRTKQQGTSFQDITLRGKVSYKLSGKLLLEGDVQQVAAGRDFGNFLYDAKLDCGRQYDEVGKNSFWKGIRKTHRRRFSFIPTGYPTTLFFTIRSATPKPTVYPLIILMTRCGLI